MKRNGNDGDNDNCRAIHIFLTTRHLETQKTFDFSREIEAGSHVMDLNFSFWRYFFNNDLRLQSYLGGPLLKIKHLDFFCLLSVNFSLFLDLGFLDFCWNL